MNWKPWYNKLRKPSWTPSPKTIGTIWSILYPIIFTSYSYVFIKTIQGEIPPIIACIFALNLVANFLFTPMLFGLKNLWLALLDILVVWVTIILTIIFIYPYSHLVAFTQLPYFTWVSIATTLQLTITFLNSD